MKRFLTLDWDYFVDADATFRLWNFPDTPNENYPQDIQNLIWTTHYGNTRLGEVVVKRQELLDVASLIKDALKFNPNIEVMVSDSHAFMYDIVTANVGSDEEFEIINFDFHHDLYKRFNQIDCGNWCTALFEKFPNMRYVWVRQNDSNTKIFDDLDFSDLPKTHSCIGFQDLKKYYQKSGELYLLPHCIEEIHICRSSMWSPPHLDEKFKNFITHTLGLSLDSIVLLDDLAMSPRTIDNEVLEAERAVRQSLNDEVVKRRL